jgi:hypothetical protein
VTKEPSQSEQPQRIELKDPAMAALLAWLVPGLGHYYQGRRAKAILYFVCIMGTFIYGLYLGGSRELGWGRAVYFSWRPGDKRPHYLCQLGIGIPAMPALVQANRVRDGKEPLFGYFMAPPELESDRADPGDQNPPYTLDTLHAKLHRFFDFGTVYTMVAGLLNILAAGPLPRGEHGLMETQLLANLWTKDFWYALPLIVAVSLVYAATRHEAIQPILRHAIRFGTWVIGFMAVIFAVLLLGTWCQ